MRYIESITGLAAIAALTIGCALREPTIELSAADFDLAPLVGKWSGNYSSQETGRSGDISFTLKAGEAEASGAVVMVPKSAVINVVPPDRQMVRGAVVGEQKQLLTIHFVRKQGNAVIGSLDPYVDPDCACRVTTMFQGSLVNGRTIQGTYKTSSSDLVYTPTHGEWKVTLLKRL